MKREVRFSVDPGFMAELQKKTGCADPVAVVQQALSLFDWVVREKKSGREFGSWDPAFQAAHPDSPMHLTRPALPSLND